MIDLASIDIFPAQIFVSTLPQVLEQATFFVETYSAIRPVITEVRGYDTINVYAESFVYFVFYKTGGHDHAILALHYCSNLLVYCHEC